MKFSETVSDFVDKGIEVSKKVVSQAGNAVQKFSDKSMVRLEKRQLESKRENSVKELGRIAVATFIADGANELRATDPSVSEILATIKNYNEEIARRDAALAAFDEKSDDGYASESGENAGESASENTSNEEGGEN